MTRRRPGSEPPPTEGGNKVGLFAALRIRNYRLVFLGQLVSYTGTWMQRVAQDWLVLELTGSPLAVGVTTSLQFLPLPLLGLWGGLVADRYPKLRLVIGTQLVMAILAAALAVLTLTGAIRVWHVYALAFGLGLATVIDNPARQTLVNEMVPRELVRNAVGLNSSIFNLGRAVGPAMAGFLIGSVGTGWAFAINTVSFLAVLGGLAMVRVRDLVLTPRVAAGPGQLRETFRYVRDRPGLAWLLVLVAAVGTLGYNFPVLLVAYVRDVFRAGPELFGWLTSAVAVGSVAGALAAGRVVQTPRFALHLAAAALGLLLAGLGLTTALWLFAVLLIVIGMVSIGFANLANSSVQLDTDPMLRGRVTSLYMLVFLGSAPLGSITVGGLTEMLGPASATIISGAGCVIAAAFTALVARRHRRAPRDVTRRRRS